MSKQLFVCRISNRSLLRKLLIAQASQKVDRFPYLQG